MLAALAAPTGVAANSPAVDADSLPGATAAADRPTEPASLYPVPDLAEHIPPCPARLSRRPTTSRPVQPRPDPEVYGQNLPDPVEVESHEADLTALNGKGMWWTVWPGTQVDVAGAVRRAKDAGLRQIWVRTGGTAQGLYGGSLLERLLPAAHDVGLAVVAWDFPKLSDPVADAARARRVIEGTFGGEHIDAFSPDIETGAEGTYLSPQRVKVYLSRVRSAAGNRPVIATVMNPTPSRLSYYPYAAMAPYVDAFAPMVYWGCAEPGEAAAAAIEALADMRPVHLIGQAYNMAPEGNRRGLPTGAEIWRFLDVAKRHGAIGASFFDAETASSGEWAALGGYPWKQDDDEDD
jgi:hypothetical protein